LTIDTQEPLKPHSAHVDEAVQLAIAGRWEEAVELNRFLIETFDPDEATQNRLGKALTELGRYAEAKQAYDASLAVNPHNPVARKNVQKLEALMSNDEDIAEKLDAQRFAAEEASRAAEVADVIAGGAAG